MKKIHSFKKLLHVWWLSLFIFAALPMANAQEITGIMHSGSVYPGEDVTFTLTVTGFTDHASYNYYVVWDDDSYDRIVKFTNDQSGDIVKTLDASGDGTIAVTATVPTNLYRFTGEDATVLVIDNNGSLVYQLDQPMGVDSEYPGTGDYNVGDKDFTAYNKVDRIFESPVFFELDNSTSLEFTLYRNNEEPAVLDDIVLQYKKGTGAWTDITTLSLNDAGLGFYFETNSVTGGNDGSTWPTAMEGSLVQLRIIQTNGNTLSSGIDTWSVEDFNVYEVNGEAVAGSDYFEVFGEFWVKDLIDAASYDEDAGTEDADTFYDILDPSFIITQFNHVPAGPPAGVDLYPGVEVSYEITSTNINFPAGSIVEIYLRDAAQNADFRYNEIVVDAFPVTDLPAAGASKDFTFIVPFTPGVTYDLVAHVQYRGQYFNHIQTDLFTVLPVTLNILQVEYDDTPAAQKLELDGITYLYSGSEVFVDYALGVDETINTDSYDVDIILDYSTDGGTNWFELSREAFTMNAADQTISGLIPDFGTTNQEDIDIRLRLEYGDNIDLVSDIDDNYISITPNYNQLPYYATWLWPAFESKEYKAGSVFMPTIFVNNTVAQDIVIDAYIDGLWTTIGTIPTLATDDKFVSRFCVNAFDLVPAEETSAVVDQVRVRWEEGNPLGENKAMINAYRIAEPATELSDIDGNGIVSGTATVYLMNPYLTLSPNLEKYYEFPGARDGEGVYSVTADVDLTSYYNTYGFSTTTQIAAVLVQAGNDPTTDPYYYLGSKAVAGNGETSLALTLDYEEVKAIYDETGDGTYGDELPFGPYMGADKAWDIFTVECISSYIAGETQWLDFEMYAETPDWEYVLELELNFPDGVTPISATEIPSDGWGPMPYTIDGQLVNWQGTVSPSGGQSYFFSVEVDIPADFTAPLSVGWYSLGDYGTEIYDASGEVWISPSEFFDIYLYATDKTAEEPIQFMTEEFTFGFEDYDEQPVMITEMLDLTELPAPTYLVFDWVASGMSDESVPVLEYTTNEGQNWIEIPNAYDDEIVELTGDMLSATTRFRWFQEIELGTWDVQNPKIQTGETNLLPIYYTSNGMPATIALARQNVDAPVVVVDPCEEFNEANLDAYEFTTAVENVYTGTEFDFSWDFLYTEAKSVSNQVVTAYDQYIHGDNEMIFNLEFDSDYAVTEFEMTFPTGVTPTAASDIYIGGNTLTAVVAGQAVTWTSDAGVILSADIDFSVDFTVAETVTGAIDVPFTLTDVDGDVAGTCVIDPVSQYPEGTVFDFYFMDGFDKIYIAEDITELGTVTAYFPTGYETGLYNIFVDAEYEYWDESLATPDWTSCGVDDDLVYEGLFVIAEETPEVYEIVINDFVAVNEDETDLDFYFGGQMQVDFETFGPYHELDPNIKFQIHLDADDTDDLGNMLLLNLDIVETLGENSVLLDIPSIEELEEAGFEYDVDLDNITGLFVIAAYVASEDYPELVFGQKVADLNSTDDYFDMNDGDGDFDFEFEDVEYDEDTETYTERFAITRNLSTYLPEGEVYDDHYLEFELDYYEDDEPITLETVVRFEISTDFGVTYETVDYFYEEFDGYYIYDISQEIFDLADAVYFRWIQTYPAGEWELSDVNIMSGYTNYLPSVYEISGGTAAFTGFEFIPEEIEDPYVDYTNLDAYDWFLVDLVEETPINFDPAIYVGETEMYDYSFDIDEDVEEIDGDLFLGATQVYEWPEGTEFVFYIDLNENNADDAEYFEIATTTTLGVNIENIMSEEVPTGMYTIYANAIIWDELGEVQLHGFPWGLTPEEAALPAEEQPEDHLLDPSSLGESVLVINQIPVEEPAGIELLSVTPVNDPENEDLDADVFYFGEQMEVVYEVYGEYAADARFEVVLEQDGLQLNLGNQADLGTITEGPIDIPSQAELEELGFDFETDPMHADFEILVYKYCGDETTELVYDAVVQYEIEDVDLISTLNFDNFEFAGNIDEVDEFQSYAVTESLDKFLVDIDDFSDIRLVFDWEIDVPVLTLQTLPRFEVSYDNGETWGVATEDVVYLLNDDDEGTVIYPLTQDMLDNAADVHFRWIQDYPEGMWWIWDIDIVTGNSNMCEPIIISDEEVIDFEEVPVTYPDIYDNYVFTVGVNDEIVDLMPSVYVDTDVEYSWVIDETLEDYDVENTWPLGTLFTFFIEVGEDEDTGDPIYETIGEVTDFGTFTYQLTDVPTGVYEVYVLATVGEGEDAYVYDDENLDANVVESIFVINQESSFEARKIVVDFLQYDDEMMPLVFGDDDFESYEAGEMFTINYELFGEWPVGTEFAAVLYQEWVDDGEDMENYYILEIESSDVETMNVYMPDYVEDIEDDEFFVVVVPYVGEELNFGDMSDEVEIEMTDGDDDDELLFNDEGDRFAYTEVMDLTGYSSASLEFYYEGNGIVETPNTLPMLMVSNGGDFVAMEIEDDAAEFGLGGFLPADWAGTLEVEIPAEYLTATTQFLFVQEINRGIDMDTWSIDELEVISGDANDLANFEKENNDQQVELEMPEIANYDFRTERDADGFEIPYYAGSTVNFYYGNYDEDGEMIGMPYPEGTEIEYFIVIEDELIPMEVTYDDTQDYPWTYVLPDNIEMDDYNVYANIMLDDFYFVDGEMLFEEDLDDDNVGANGIGVIHVFNPVLFTEVTTEEVVYAGNNVSVIGVLENTLVELNTEWYYNLVMTDDDGDDWLLAYQQGDVEFTDVPTLPFIHGEVQLNIEATLDAPMGTVGELVDIAEIVLLDEEYEFVRPYGEEDMYAEAVSLSDIESVKFDLWLEDLDVFTNGTLDFGYLDGNGFTVLESYPNDNLTEDDLETWLNIEVMLPEAAQQDDIYLIWYVEATETYYSINNIALVPMSVEYTLAPMVSNDTELTIADQRIDAYFDATVDCDGATISFDYYIEGKFGADNQMKVWLEQSENWGYYSVDGEDFVFTGITEGTGTLEFDLMLDDNIDDWDFTERFWLTFDAIDETREDYEYEIYSDYDYLDIELIDEVNPATTVSTVGDEEEEYSCSEADRIVKISGVQMNFSYQLRNAVTGATISEAVVIGDDEEEDEDLLDANTYPYYDQAGNLEINIGAVTEELIVEVVVTAQNEDGSVTCETLIPDAQVLFDVRDFVLQYQYADGTTQVGDDLWLDVAEGTEFNICEASEDLVFRLFDLNEDNNDEDGTAIPVDWYRGEDNTPIAQDEVENAHFPLTGSYYALYDYNNPEECADYVSTSAIVTVIERPEKPVIVFEGETEFCEGSAYPTLTVADNYAFYRWKGTDDDDDEILTSEELNSNSITLEQGGKYTVEVSNVEFDPFLPVCSVEADEYNVDLIVHKKAIIPTFNSTAVGNVLCEAGPVQVMLGNTGQWNNVEPDGNTYYQLYDYTTGTATGAEKLGNEAINYLYSASLTEDARLGVMAWSANTDNLCGVTYSPNYIDVAIHDLEIVAYGNTLVAVSETGLVLDPIDSYTWLRNGNLMMNDDNDEFLTIYDNAEYSVIVTTQGGCYLESTASKTGSDLTTTATEITMSVYPNPATEYITVNYTSAIEEELQIRVVDVKGSVVYDVQVQKSENEYVQEISLDELQNGTYMIQVIGSESVQVQQFIKF